MWCSGLCDNWCALFGCIDSGVFRNLERGPSISSPLPFHWPPLTLSSSPSFPSFPLEIHDPLSPATGLGKCCKLFQRGLGWSPMPKSNLVRFSLEIWRLVATISVIFHSGNFSRVIFWPYTRFFCRSRRGAWPKWPNSKYAYVYWHRVIWEDWTTTATEWVLANFIFKCEMRTFRELATKNEPECLHLLITVQRLCISMESKSYIPDTCTVSSLVCYSVIEVLSYLWMFANVYFCSVWFFLPYIDQLMLSERHYITCHASVQSSYTQPKSTLHLFLIIVS